MGVKKLRVNFAGQKKMKMSEKIRNFFQNLAFFFKILT